MSDNKLQVLEPKKPGAEDPKLRDEFGMFKKGTPGGPGRPKLDPEVKRILHENTVAAVQKLVDLLEAERTIVVGAGDNAYTAVVPDTDIQLKAAQAILDRAYGKAPQSPMQLVDEDGKRLRAAVIILPGDGGDSDENA